MDVSHYSYDTYENNVAVNYNVKEHQTYYTITHNYHVLVNKYKCSTNALVITEQDYYSPSLLQISRYNSSAVRDQAWNNLPSSYEVAGANMCSTYDRYYVTKYYRNGSTGSQTEEIGNYDGTAYMGSYTTMQQASNAAAQYQNGMSFNGGIVTGAYAFQEYVGTPEAHAADGIGSKRILNSGNMATSAILELRIPLSAIPNADLSKAVIIAASDTVDVDIVQKN
ncbi:hypothetical protein [Paenibacillus sp. FSL R5-0914]|uniref:hypothetical protein n=1 Tax=Paenibacillus sp. FSL R5-0914 TaxID=2921665 RepID=UPI0030F94AD7